jgi:outer membrane protein assembly factor BamE (lipoprotein component of BamABCDE complex)
VAIFTEGKLRVDGVVDLPAAATFLPTTGAPMRPIYFATILAAALLLAGCAGWTGTGVMRTDAQVAQVQRGMTRDEVVAVLGPPFETMRFRNGTDSLDYLSTDSWGYLCRFSAIFDESGRVVSTVSARLNDGSDHGH